MYTYRQPTLMRARQAFTLLYVPFELATFCLHSCPGQKTLLMGIVGITLNLC